MINFCKKSFNTIFNTASTAFSTRGEDSSAYRHRITPLPVFYCDTGLNSLIITGKIPKSNSVTVSSLVNSPVKSDQNETGLKVVNSGDTDRLASCTESLGFESCNERSINNNIYRSEKLRANGKSSKVDKNKVVKSKSFPPLLSSFNGNGKPTFFLRPVRNNGRLKLTEVKINRPETLRACREDGRLRLHLVESDYTNDDVITSTAYVVGDKLGDDMDKQIVEELKFPEIIGGGEDCQWLHEMAKNQQQQQHNMQGWGAMF
ncbi:uncharacterized protein LOC141672834 [Apium graveolens]|uniref:uncharacterized protein LOC141672834 n=1 Tax=Apium graveolens TaxID=4045 RepID=UPI003D7916A4